MIDPLHYDLIIMALKALFLIALPIVLALSLAGTLVAVVQTATAISEPTLGYGVRLITLAVLLYFLFPAFWQTVLELVVSGLKTN